MRIAGKYLTKEDWLEIANGYAEKGATKLSQELSITKQRIRQIVVQLRKEGVDIPKIRGTKGYKKEYIKFVKENLKTNG